MTFSVVARQDSGPEPEWGVAVASKFLAVGAVVPWAAAGAGAVATQAMADVSFGPRGLERLRAGDHAPAVIDAFTRDDGQRDHRQVGVVDARGSAATFTGSECMEWAGGMTGDGFCCQGNVLAGPEVIERMSDAFDKTPAELPVRLLAALSAGDAAGGDRRGRQSAAMIVVREGGGYGGTTDRVVDLRVDDHADPVRELGRLLTLHRLYFPRPEELRFVDVDERLADELRGLLAARGYEPRRGTGYDTGLRNALYQYVGTENLEERWSDDARVERVVLERLRERAQNT